MIFILTLPFEPILLPRRQQSACQPRRKRKNWRPCPVFARRLGVLAAFAYCGVTGCESTAAASAAAVGRIAPGRDQQRHVVVAFRLCNGKSHRHDIEEWRIGRRRAAPREIVADVERSEERRVGKEWTSRWR